MFLPGAPNLVSTPIFIHGFKLPYYTQPSNTPYIFIISTVLPLLWVSPGRKRNKNLSTSVQSVLPLLPQAPENHPKLVSTGTIDEEIDCEIGEIN
jgi:hypothetical protein